MTKIVFAQIFCNILLQVNEFSLGNKAITDLEVRSDVLH
jgi:hypothetical protein